MLSFQDQLHRTIVLPQFPARIVSLVPSQTELLHYLGLEDRVVGITKFCVHPHEWFKSKSRIGGTKSVDIKKVLALQPDLIIANKEENIKEQVDELSMHSPLWISDVSTLNEAYAMIVGIGNLTGTTTRATELVNLIKEQWVVVNNTPVSSGPPLTCAYLIWRNPYMTVGNDTFIHDMLTQCGLTNAFKELKRYPEVTVDVIRDKGIDVLFLSSEPYPFTDKHMAEIQTALPDVKIILVDGESFSWYGSRLLHATAYLASLIKQLRT